MRGVYEIQMRQKKKRKGVRMRTSADPLGEGKTCWRVQRGLAQHVHRRSVERHSPTDEGEQHDTETPHVHGRTSVRHRSQCRAPAERLGCGTVQLAARGHERSLPRGTGRCGREGEVGEDDPPGATDGCAGPGASAGASSASAGANENALQFEVCVRGRLESVGILMCKGKRGIRTAVHHAVHVEKR